LRQAKEDNGGANSWPSSSGQRSLTDVTNYCKYIKQRNFDNINVINKRQTTGHCYQIRSQQALSYNL